MSNISSIEKLKLEKLFEMSGGYVLDFSNRTFREFFLDNLRIDIYHPQYNYESGSKANRLRAFWKVEENAIVGKSILALLEYWKSKKEINGQIITFEEDNLYDGCMNIAERLIQDKPITSKIQQEMDLRKKMEHEASKEHQLNLLLQMFDELALSTDNQRRGYLLEELLNTLFINQEIPVYKSFKRNEGGEQIDGLFYLQGWYYLVECKWTTKLADIGELDSFSGKVNRSGKQSMGVFLSIDGWSENVPKLLKQYPEKSVILMDGYDLRCILSGALALEELLVEKITKLNKDTEPFFSAVEILKKK
jgi:hypothetical protein